MVPRSSRGYEAVSGVHNPENFAFEEPPGRGARHKPEKFARTSWRIVAATKLILKGLDPEKFNVFSPDDPVIIARVAAVAHEMGLVIN